MKKTITLFLLMLLPLICQAQTELPRQVVAEQQLLSVAGEPVTYELAFSDSGFADFVLKVVNGEGDGSKRISSALISLNGMKVLIPADFNQQVQTLERVISPLPGKNSLAVTMRSNPGGMLHVQVVATPTFLLPPDPGPAGDTTLEGVDANGNGIRDDVERWIYLTYPGSEKLRRALIQEYYPMQNMIIHGHQQDRDAVYNDMDAMMRSGECLNYVHPDNSHLLSAEIKSRIVNTDERFYGFTESSRLLGGGTFSGRFPSEWKTSCTFDPDAMAN